MDPVRIMVVDDAADARMLIGLILGEHDDLTVVAEADGAESAMQQLPAARPDVVLLDARMPVTDGFDLARQVLALADVRVAILTSMVDDVVRERAAAAGAHAVLSKGDLPDLPQIVRDLVRG